MPIVRNIITPVAAALTIGLAAACGAPAQYVEAAPKKPTFKGVVTICYSPSAKSDPYGQYLHNQWNVNAAVKAAGSSIGKVKVVTEKYPQTTCFGQVRIASAPAAHAYGQNVNPKSAYGIYKLVDSGEIWESQIGLGDKVGAGATAAQRQAWLVAALKAGIPR